MRFGMWCLPRGSGKGGVTARGALCVSMGPLSLLDLLLFCSSGVGELLSLGGSSWCLQDLKHG